MHGNSFMLATHFHFCPGHNKQWITKWNFSLASRCLSVCILCVCVNLHTFFTLWRRGEGGGGWQVLLCVCVCVCVCVCQCMFSCILHLFIFYFSSFPLCISSGRILLLLLLAFVLFTYKSFFPLGRGHHTSFLFMPSLSPFLPFSLWVIFGSQLMSRRVSR